MDLLLTWAVFIFAFGGMVIIHELGHFIAARLCKIEVEEFGLGLPTPGAITLFTWQGTRFTLNWLPLGGFVRPKGENDPEVPGGLAAANPWKRFFVLVAGPVMNLLTAILIYSFIFYRVGVPDVSRVMVTAVVANSPAAEAGIQSGDIFVSGNGQSINGFEDLRAIVDANADQSVAFVVERDNAQIELTATPKFFEDENRVMIGVGLDSPYKRVDSFSETITLGAQYTYLQANNLISLPGRWLSGMLSPEESRVIGLKGIFDVVGQTVSRDVEASQNLSASPQPSTDPLDQPILTLGLIAGLSISLGIFNLFPFPALDGGRIIFLLPELIFRRRVPAHVENMVHGLGMMVLLAFMLYVNIMDFVKPANFTIP